MKERCQMLDRAPNICNGCDKGHARYTIPHKYHYDALFADRRYRETLRDSRSGISLSREKLHRIDAVITPLIWQSHSPLSDRCGASRTRAFCTFHLPVHRTRAAYYYGFSDPAGITILKPNVKLSLQYCYQQGKVQINHNRFLGYTKDADGNLVIDPEQAETVKRIYREYLEGLSMDKIAAGLERDDILTGVGGKKWHTSTINKILRNEKYIGDALLQKTYTTDFLNKTRVKNNGLVPQYYVEGDHEAIIPKDIYLQVQEELVRRRVVKTSANGKKRSYSCNHCFFQIVICGECGEIFRRLHWNNRGVKSIVWRCISRLESTGLECHARTINELILEDVVVKAINQMLGGKSSYQAQLQLNIAAVIRASQVTAIDSIDEKLMALQQELIQKANSKEAYDEIADEIFRLRELRQKTTVDTAARNEQIKRINDLQDYIAQRTTYLTEFDKSLVRR